eukprot:GHVU01118264.1.p1 GENE.GHVU01118264.1~~GHVU01118264.1.p1  ORF type:complete len:138 (-),score=3.84 GHVU01118264.1:3760-4173(-)
MKQIIIIKQRSEREKHKNNARKTRMTPHANQNTMKKRKQEHNRTNRIVKEKMEIRECQWWRQAMSSIATIIYWNRLETAFTMGGRGYIYTIYKPNCCAYRSCVCERRVRDIASGVRLSTDVVANAPSVSPAVACQYP